MSKPIKWYYVKVNGERWSPVVSHEKAINYYKQAVEIFRIGSRPSTIQLVHIEKQIMVGRY